MRGLSNIQAAIVLVERGLTQESETLCRSGLETVFYLGAVLRDPTFIDSLIKDHSARRKTLANAILSLDEAFSDDVRSKVATFLKEIESPDDEKEKVKTIGIFSAAKSAELKDIYETYYRTLSNDSAHPSIASLDRYIDSDEDGNVRGFLWGPFAIPIDDAVQQIATVLFYLTCFGNEMLGSKNLEAELLPLWNNYKGLTGLNDKPAPAS